MQETMTTECGFLQNRDDHEPCKGEQEPVKDSWDNSALCLRTEGGYSDYFLTAKDHETKLGTNQEKGEPKMHLRALCLRTEGLGDVFSSSSWIAIEPRLNKKLTAFFLF
jgi:hypothetical protein